MCTHPIRYLTHRQRSASRSLRAQRINRFYSPISNVLAGGNLSTVAPTERCGCLATVLVTDAFTWILFKLFKELFTGIFG